ncbi:fructosamine-3-kinase [Pontibacter aydingkolensis]|uniref:DUF3592 domain-containing protein n=1 Tax=Pontibacter aydingkolensis TaxID=1911536 RepID=A0ABS7CT61_9BACT|nr:hypothetical protein [Pontibacter aydingkolensis]MBW7467027.1 hypothetical protein [Pontibacter aydingkolensis]
MVGHAIKVLLSCLVLVSVKVVGQDIIVKKNGEQIIGKVIALSTDTIQYRYFSDLNGRVQAMPRSEIAQLKLVAAAEPVQVAKYTYTDEETSINEMAQLRLQAKLDANSYYKARGVFWTTMGSTIMHPAAGFATGAVISAIPADIDSDYNPNRHLMKEQVYRESYQKQARKRKIGNAAAGFGAGAAVLSIIYMVVIVGAVGGA